jgi:hypothetical protein
MYLHNSRFSTAAVPFRYCMLVFSNNSERANTIPSHTAAASVPESCRLSEIVSFTAKFVAVIMAPTGAGQYFPLGQGSHLGPVNPALQTQLVGYMVPLGLRPALKPPKHEKDSHLLGHQLPFSQKGHDDDMLL